MDKIQLKFGIKEKEFLSEAKNGADYQRTTTPPSRYFIKKEKSIASIKQFSSEPEFSGLKDFRDF